MLIRKGPPSQDVTVSSFSTPDHPITSSSRNAHLNLNRISSFSGGREEEDKGAGLLTGINLSVQDVRNQFSGGLGVNSTRVQKVIAN